VHSNLLNQSSISRQAVKKSLHYLGQVLKGGHAV